MRLSRHALSSATRATTLVAAIVISLFGCERQEAAKSAASGDDTPPAAKTGRAATSTRPGPDAAADDSGELAEYLAWADDELRKRPKPVDPPASAERPTPRWQVLRLTDAFDPANVECAWTSTADADGALASVGPFRSDERGKNWFVNRTQNRKGRPSVEMTISGFDLICRDIGRITMRVRIPHAKFLEINWKHGRIRLPLPGGDEPETLTLPTDGLAEFKGRLTELTLRADGVPEDAVASVEYLRLLGRSDAYPKPVAVARVSLGREVRTAMYAHLPSRIVLNDVTPPPNGELQVGLGMLVGKRPAADSQPTSTEAPGVRFRVTLECDGETHDVFDRTIDTPDLWMDVNASLAEFAGRTVTLRLSAESDSPDVIAFWGSPVLYEPVENPPLAIMYLIDALSAKHVNMYGYTRETMPRLTELAKGGVWFANAYCNSPVTVVSVKDLLLSMPATRHGVFSYSQNAPDQLVSFPEILHDAGFATCFMSTNVNAGPRQHNDIGFESFIDRINPRYKTDVHLTIPVPTIVDWMNQHRDRPMFLYIHTAEPHSPYNAPPEYHGHFDGDGPSKSGSASGVMVQAQQGGDRSTWVSRYDEEVYFADDRLGMFVDALKQEGLFDAANFFVIADHGEELNEHGHFGHGHGLYDEAIRIPYVAFGPLISHRGRADRPVQLFDIMPTILDLLNFPMPYELAGSSLKPILDGDATLAADTQRTLFHSFFLTRGQGLVQYVVIEDATWKLMFIKDDNGSRDDEGRLAAKFELYNLIDDPRERTNVIKDHPDVVRRLIGHLLEYIQRQAPFKIEKKTEELEFDAEQIQRLRDLGYVD